MPLCPTHVQSISKSGRIQLNQPFLTFTAVTKLPSSVTVLKDLNATKMTTVLFNHSMAFGHAQDNICTTYWYEDPL